MNGTTEIKYKYRIKIEDREPINWDYNKEDIIKNKGETLIWTDGSVLAHENKKITIGAIFYNKKSTRNRTCTIEGRLHHILPNAQ